MRAKKEVVALCKGGTVVVSGCRNCRALMRYVTAPVRRLDGEFLPKGEWPAEKNGQGSESSLRRTKRLPDYSRPAFLRGLNIVQRVTGIQIFGGRRYEGFVVQSRRSQRLIALLDCDLMGNALYAFDASAPDWTDAAQRTKYELKEKKPKELLRKVNHVGNWQSRVLQLLE